VRVVDDMKCIVVTAVYVSVPCHIPTFMDPDVTWGNGKGCPLVEHYWMDLQSVHGFRCYDNRGSNVKCQRVLVLALFLVRDVKLGFFLQPKLACSKPNINRSSKSSG